MGHGRGPQHPMKMGGGPTQADSVVSGLKTLVLRELSDAMNMAWIGALTSTMFRVLNRNPSH